MVTTLNITLDDDVADDLRATKEALGLTWAEFLEWAGAQAAEQGDATTGREPAVTAVESQADPEATETRAAHETAQKPARDVDEEAPPESGGPTGATGAPTGADGAGVDVDRDQLRDELPGSGDLLEARVDAIVAMYRYLREHGTAEKDDFTDLVDVDAVGYASPDSVWANMVKGRDTLRALPGVETPPPGRTEWAYRGELDE